MTEVSGSLQIADPAVTITKWELKLLSAAQLAEEDDLVIETTGSIPTDWSFDTGYAESAYLVAIRPFCEGWWYTDRVYPLGTLVMGQEKPSLFLHELTGINPVNTDPDWSSVVFRITGDAGGIDDKGHTVTYGSPRHQDTGGAWLTPQGEGGSYLGLSSMRFSPGSYEGPIILDHADLDLGTGDFSLQFWFRDYYGSSRGTVFCLGVPGSGTELKLEGKRFEPMRLWLGATQLFQTENFPSSTYTRWILTRQNGELKIIRNGALSTTIALAGAITGPLYLGALPTAPKAVWTGDLFDFCLTKGMVRETDTHTPWVLKSLGPQVAKTGIEEPTWATTLNGTTQDGAYTWTAKHHLVQPIIHGPVWPVAASE